MGDAALLKYLTWFDGRYTLWPILEGWILLADGEGWVAYGQRPDPSGGSRGVQGPGPP